MANTCVDPNVLDIDSQGRLTTRTHAVRMLNDRTPHRVNPPTQVIGSWDTLEYQFGDALTANRQAGVITVNRTGLYSVDLAHRDTVARANVDVTVALELLHNGVAVGSDSNRREGHSLWLHVDTDLLLQAGDVLRAQWTFADAAIAYDLEPAIGNYFSACWIGYAR